MPLMNKCCCCNLRTNVIYQGWPCLIVDIACLFLIIFVRSETEEILKEEYGTDASYLYWFMFGIVVIETISNVLLLWGAYKKLYWMLLPKLIFCGILIIVIMIAVFRNILALVKDIGSFDIDDVKILSYAAVQVYSWFSIFILCLQFCYLKNRRLQEEVERIV